MFGQRVISLEDLKSRIKFHKNSLESLKGIESKVIKSNIEVKSTELSCQNTVEDLIIQGKFLSKALFKYLNKISINKRENTINLFVYDKNSIELLVSFLKLNSFCQYSSVSDIGGVDYLGFSKKRFEVVYSLLSIRFGSRIRICLKVNEFESVPSISKIHPSASWYEREVWDLFGVFFTGHPDLRRILTDYGFEGFPLRKDFPISGFNEIRYDDSKKRLVYEPLEIAQEFRYFDFKSPWEQVDSVY